MNSTLRSLNRRGLRGVKLVISDSHEGIKAAVAKVIKATWQRCRVHFMRNALAHASKTQRRMVAAAIGTVFVQDTAEAARTQWRTVADQLLERLSATAAKLDETFNQVGSKLSALPPSPAPDGAWRTGFPVLTYAGSL